MYIRLSRAWYVVPEENGLQLWRFSDRKRLRVQGDREQLIAAATLLTNGLPEKAAASTIARETRWSIARAEQLISLLTSAKVVLREVVLNAPVPKEPERQLYDPQIEYFSRWEVEGRPGSRINEELQNRKVVVIGLGGYGSWLMALLARIGVRSLVGIDKDQVEVSNLSRQVLYTADDVGKAKAIGARDYVHSIDPSISVEAVFLNVKEPGDLVPYIEGADLVFIPFGYAPSNRPSMAVACAEQGVPFMVSGLFGIGPLCVPGETPCHNCMVLADPQIQEASRPLRRYRWALPASAFAPELAFSASFTVMEAARFLASNERPRTLDGAYQFDSRSYDVRFHLVERHPGCEICAKAISNK